jgi:hypothetical protein
MTFYAIIVLWLMINDKRIVVRQLKCAKFPICHTGHRRALCHYNISSLVCLTVPNQISIEIGAKRDAHMWRGARSRAISSTRFLGQKIFREKIAYRIPFLVRASLIRAPSVVRGFERQNVTFHPLKMASK